MVENLSCLILLGNDFLEQNNSIIDFDNQIIILNNNNIITTHLSCQQNINQLNTNVIEKTIDLFETHEKYSIAHCISADLKMSKGIALDICKKYGNLTSSLLQSNPQIGDAIPLVVNKRVIYFLITKNYYFEKPQYDDIKKTLENLKLQMIKHHDTDIAIPKISNGLDKKDWTIIKQIIISIFKNTSINILICHKEKHILCK